MIVVRAVGAVIHVGWTPNWASSRVRVGREGLSPRPRARSQRGDASMRRLGASTLSAERSGGDRVP